MEQKQKARFSRQDPFQIRIHVLPLRPYEAPPKRSHWAREELEDPQPSFDAELFPEPSEGDSDSDSTGSWLLSSWTGGALHMRSQKSDKYQD